MGPRNDEPWTEHTRSDSTTTADASAVADADAPLWVLFRVHGGKSALRSAALAPGVTVVGRAVPEGIRLADDRSSRIHASLVVEADGVTVEDHDTRNGTFVDGTRIHAASARDGSVLRFGDSLCVLRRTTARALDDASMPEVIGASPAACALRRQLAALAPTAAWVLLLGETGVGKEVCARVLHQKSDRRGPFVAVNCGAIPAELAESQLFGHAKGAFTGADSARDGWFQAADGGTLFLDEIGELPLTLQPKLLRVLDERVVARVGDTRGRAVDVRIVAATHRDLGREVEQGTFRADLLARLSEVVIEIPPLRARREDVLLLLRHFLADDRPLSADLAAALLAHRWPFNVREVAKLGGELKARAAGATRYELALVAKRLRAETPTSTTAPAPDAAAARARTPPPTKAELLELLRAHRGNVLELARAVRRSRKQVYRWLGDLGVDPADYREAKAARPRRAGR